MKIYQQWAKNIYWWLPTRDDQVKNREEELERINEEYTQVLSKLLMFGEEFGDFEDKLLATFSPEQHELWLKLKSASQKQHFERTRLKHFDDRIKEIPEEISKIRTETF